MPTASAKGTASATNIPNKLYIVVKNKKDYPSFFETAYLLGGIP